LREAYLELTDVWSDIPVCRVLAEKLTSDDAAYKRLDVTQLVKHILGLKFGRKIDKVRLVYLYYDSIGYEAGEHREEILRFQELISKDQIRFIPITVQEYLVRAVRYCRSEHKNYVDYLTERYL